MNDDQKDLFKSLSKNMSMEDLQSYFLKVLKVRGFSEQSLKDKVFLLAEELGELAKAVRKDEKNMPVDISKINNCDSVEGEIADMGILLISICNLLNLNLFDCIINKEKINVERKWK